MVNTIGPGAGVQRGQVQQRAGRGGRIRLLGQSAPGAIAHRAAVGRRGFKHPAHQLQITHPRLQQRGLADNGRRQARCGGAQGAAPGQHGGQRVQWMAHAHGLQLRADKTIGVGGHHAQFHQAGRAGHNAQTPQAVQLHRRPAGRAHRRAAHEHAEAGDGAEAVGAHGGQHGLARQHRGAGGEVDQDLRRVGAGLGHDAQGEALRGGVAAVAHAGEHHKIAHLAGAGGPQQRPCRGVIAGALGQVAEADHQRRGLRQAVGVKHAQRAGRSRGALDHRQAEALPHQQRVAGGADLRQTVHVEHPHLHRALHGGRAIAGGKSEGVGAGIGHRVVHGARARRPLKVAGVGVEANAIGRVGVVHQGQARGIVVAVHGLHREGERLALLHQLQRQRQQLRRLVHVAHHHVDLAGDLGVAVARANAQTVVARCGRCGAIAVVALRAKQAGRPTQRQSSLAVAAGGGLQGHAGGQAGHRPVDEVDIGVASRQIKRQGHAFVHVDRGERARQAITGHRAAGGRHVDQLRRGVGGTHDDAQVGHRGVGRGWVVGVEHVTGVGRRQAAVADLQAQVKHPRCAGHPADIGVAVLRVGDDAGPSRQALRGVAQRVLVQVAHEDGDADLLPDQRHRLTRHGDHRRLAGAAHREHKALGHGGHLVDVAVAVVLRHHGDGVVAAVAHAGREMDHPGDAAAGCAGLRVAGKRGQPGHRDGERVAVGVHRADGDVEHRAPVHEGVHHVADHGRAVGVAHHDGQRDLADRGRARAIAVVGGRDGDVVGAGLGITRRPQQLQRVGVKTGARRQAADRVAHAGRRVVVAGGPGRGRQAHLGLEAGVVGVKREHADAQGLAFEHLPGFHRVEHGRAVGVEHVEHQLALYAGDHRIQAIGRGVGGRQRDRQAHGAGLVIPGQPGEPAGLMVERGAGRQPRAVVVQRDGGAVGLGQQARGAACLGQCARQAARQLQREALALAQGLRRQRGQHGRGITLRHVDVKALLHGVLAVAGHHGNTGVVARLVVAGQPGQQTGGGVKARASWQVAQRDGDAVAIGVGGRERQHQRLAFGQRDRQHRIQHRHVVGAHHIERETPQGDAAAAVHHAHQHLGVGAVGGLGRPAQHGAVAVAGGATVNQGFLSEHQALRRLHQLPVKQRAIGVGGLQRAGPGLAHRGLRQGVGQRRGITRNGHCGRRVVIRHGVNAVAQVELDQQAAAWRGTKHTGRAHAHRQAVERGAHHQLAAGRAQAGVQVDDPQVGLVAAALHAAQHLVAKVAAGVQQQHHRPAQIIGADVGDRHVVAHLAGQAVGAGVGEHQAQAVGEVGHGGEHHRVGLGQAHLGGAADLRVHLQTPAPGGQIGQREHGRARAGIPAHALRRQHHAAVGAGGRQAVVGGVEHAGQVRGVLPRRTRPHGLVKADRHLRERQRQQGAIGDAAGQHMRRLDGRDLVDVRTFGHQDVAVGGGQNALAPGAAAGQLQHAPALQLDHPHAAGVRRGASNRAHGALRQVAAGQQQARQGRARAAKCNAVHQAGDAELQLGAAHGAPAHWEADDLGHRVQRGAVHGAARPAHGPQAAVRAKGQIAHALVGEVAPGIGGATDGAARLRVEDLDAVARRQVDQPRIGVNRQCMGQRVLARPEVALDHGAGMGVEQQQLAAGHHPQLAKTVQRHVEHGGVKREQGRAGAAALFGKQIHRVARSAGAGQHRPVLQFNHGERADVAVAAGKTAGKTAHLHGCQHALQIARLGGGHKARQALRGQLEQGAGRVAAVVRGGGQLGGGAEGVVGAQRAFGVGAAAVVGQHGVGHHGGLAVAGGVGGHGQEFIVVARRANELGLALRAGHLLFPDAEIAAVVGHVNGDVLDAAGVVGGLPGHGVGGHGAAAGGAGAGAGAGDGERGAGRHGVQRVRDARAVNRRRVVKKHARGGLQCGAGLGQIERAHGVAHKTGAGFAAAVGQEQAAGGVVQHLAGVGVDGLDQPGGHAADGVHARAHAQHEALVAGEIKVALEHGLAGGQVDVDVADLEVAQAQAARVDVGIELADQAQLTHRVGARVGERHGVGQREIGGHVAGASGCGQRLRAAHRHGGGGRAVARGGLLQILGEVQGLRARGVELLVEHADVAQVLQLGHAAGEHVEADEVGVLGGSLVVCRRVGRHRHGHLNHVALVVLAHLEIVDRCMRGLHVASVARGVAVPLLHLHEEALQVGLGAVAVAALAHQHAGGQGGVEAQYQRVLADRRRVGGRAQQAGGLQCRQPALHPLRLVGGQHAQRGRRAGIGQDGGAQRLGMRRLVGDELGPRQRRGRAQRVEPERHGQPFELVDMHLGVG